MSALDAYNLLKIKFISRRSGDRTRAKNVASRVLPKGGYASPGKGETLWN